MSNKTKIEWTDTTWNPIRGCSRVSEGCRNCYAEKVAKRFSGTGQPYQGLIAKSGQWNGNIKFIDHLIDAPRKWRKPRRVFVNSMSDLFHENIQFTEIKKIFLTMQHTPQHTYQVLTKRPQRMLEFFKWWGTSAMESFAEAMPHVWLGVSVEDQATANERIPLLLQTPAAIRWVSAEPLLGEVNLKDITPFNKKMDMMLALAGITWTASEAGTRVSKVHAKLNWVVAGGESGSNARPMHPDWIRKLRDQCTEASVPFFFKQWGEWLPGERMPDAFTYARCDTGVSTWPIKSNIYPNRQNFGTHPDRHSGHLIALKVGKKSAGRTLDGREWNEYPEVASSQ